MRLLILPIAAVLVLASASLAPRSSALLLRPDVVSGGGEISDAVFDLQFRFGIGARTTGPDMAKGFVDFTDAVAVTPFMFIGGPVDNIEACTSGPSCSAELTGHATVQMHDGTMHKNIPYCIEVTEGSPGVGAVSVTLEHPALDGIEGDQILGNNQYDAPDMELTKGKIVTRTQGIFIP